MNNLIINFQSGNMCDILSPDGRYGCTKRKFHTSLACANPHGKVTWCGDCLKWECEHIREVDTAHLDSMWNAGEPQDA